MSIVEEDPQGCRLQPPYWKRKSMNERGSNEDDGPTYEKKNKREDKREFPPPVK
jgi:hypothetical protein